MAKAVIISGSTSRNSRLNGIEEEAIKQLTNKGISYEKINVIDLPAEDLILANFNSEAIKKATKTVEEADAVIVLTPVYKAAYTGVLKTFLDLLPQKGFKGKPVLPLVIGGTYGHLLMIDTSLKPLFTALGATITLKGVYAIDSQVERTGENEFVVVDEVKARIKEEVEELVELILALRK